MLGAPIVLSEKKSSSTSFLFLHVKYELKAALWGPAMLPGRYGVLGQGLKLLSGCFQLNKNTGV